MSLAHLFTANIADIPTDEPKENTQKMAKNTFAGFVVVEIQWGLVRVRIRL